MTNEHMKKEVAENLVFGRSAAGKLREYLSEVQHFVNKAEAMLDRIEDMFEDMDVLTLNEEEKLERKEWLADIARRREAHPAEWTANQIAHDTLTVVNGMAKAYKGGQQ